MKKILSILAVLAFANAANAIQTIGNVTDNLDGSYILSTGSGSVSDADLETFLGLASGTLDNLAATTGGSSPNATQGSAIKDASQVELGETFSFDWEWTSFEDNPSSSFNDFAFYALIDTGLGVIADTFTADGTTGTFSYAATSAGLLQWGIGVVDDSDSVVDSFLTVSNISVPDTSSTMLLLSSGIAVLGFARRKLS